MLNINIPDFCIKILDKSGAHFMVPHLIQISNYFNIDVRIVDFEKELPLYKFFSSFTLIENNKRIIYISNKLDFFSQRVLLAHCLGHHFLGHTDKGFEFIDLSNNGNLPFTFDHYEKDANKFALYLLIHPDFLKNAFFKCKSINEIANIFQVTDNFILHYLRYLRLINF